jgi:hypothetical protein
MTYPNSSDVSAGQPTAALHYNNLRKDALYFGQAASDSKTVGDALARYAANVSISYLATNRLRIIYSSYNPAVIVIGGCLLMAAANIDLAAGAFSGAAATWYIHAVRVAGSTTFTLSVNTTPTESDTSRVIGTCYYDGSAISSITSWYGSSTGLPAPGYDSGWFACAAGSTYTKVHGLGVVPKNIILLHSANSDGSGEIILVYNTHATAGVESVIGMDATNIYLQSGTGGYGTCHSFRRQSTGGYWRVLAWS